MPDAATIFPRRFRESPRVYTAGASFRNDTTVLLHTLSRVNPSFFRYHVDMDAIPADRSPHDASHWVPIRALAPRQRPHILAHLLALEPRDRYLRFGYAAGDEQIAHYVEQIDFDSDEVFGIFNRRLEVIAMAHLAYLRGADGPARAAEFGVSVQARARGRGWGARLFDRAVLHARNRHVDTLVIHALAENAAMLRIVRKAGARIEFESGDALARLDLPAEDFGSHVEALVEHGAAEIDYRWKLQARRMHDWLHRLDSAFSAPPPAPPGTGERERAAAGAGHDGDGGPAV